MESYNLIKGIAIYFVVCIHIIFSIYTPDSIPLIVDSYIHITVFAVPIFMILGGFFFAKKYLFEYEYQKIICSNFFVNLKRIAKRIIIPYYLFVLILTLYNFCLRKKIFWWHFLFLDSNEHGLYFLIIYTYAFIFSYSIVCLLKNFPRHLIAILSAFISLFFFPLANSIFLPSKSVVVSNLPLISFYSFGILLYQINKSVLSKLRASFVVIITLLSALILSVLLIFLRYLYGHFVIIQSSPPSFFLLIYSIIFFIFVLYASSPKKVIFYAKKLLLTEFGKNSLFIFLIHPYLVKVVKLLLMKSSLFCGIPKSSNLFFILLLLSAYLITYLSHISLQLFPSKLRSLFTR